MSRASGATVASVASRAGLLATLSFSGCVAGPSPSPTRETPPLHIDVDVTLLPDDTGAFGGVSVRTCPRDAWPRRLVPENARALPFLVSAVDDKGAAIAVDDVGLKTRELTGCARVVLDVAGMADALADKDLAIRAGDDVIATPDLWLWRPEPFVEGDALYVRVEPSAELEALVPWSTSTDGMPGDRRADAAQGASGGSGSSRGGAATRDGTNASVVPKRFVVDPSAYRLKSDAAFGRFDTEEVSAAGSVFVVARLDDGRAPPPFSSWLVDAARAVSLVTGEFPVPRMNVIVLPTTVSRPIVVGFFSRGGGPTATFYVGNDEDVDPLDLEATGRWALLHELSHALLPPVRREDAWLNEGVATWYQDLLARRAGLIPDDVSYWRELVRGLATGKERAGDDGLTVEQAAARMHETGAYQHAYWAGTALVLFAEIEAQQEGSSIDDAVRAMRARFPVDDRARPALEMLDAVKDDPRGGAAARALREAFLRHRSVRWPDTDAALASLGVHTDAWGGVSLDDAAPLAAVRAAITAQR